jgi:hypothetical protein
VSGLWPFKWNNFILLSSTSNITSAFMSINPGFHKDPVVLGSWYKNVTTPNAALCPPDKTGHVDCKGSWTLDTTTLANGWHRLFIRADSLVPQNDPVLMAANAKNGPASQIGGGIFSSIVLTAFRVYNEKPSPPPLSPSPPPPSADGQVASAAAAEAEGAPGAAGADPTAVKAAITDDASSAVPWTLQKGQGSTAGAALKDLQHGSTNDGGALHGTSFPSDAGMGNEVEMVMVDTASGAAVAVSGGAGAEAVAAALTQAVQGGNGQAAEVALAASVDAMEAPNVLVVKRVLTEPRLVNVNGKPVA